MKVTFKLYATLTSYLPPGTQGHAVVMEVAEKTTVQALIDIYKISDKQAYLVMVNGVFIPPEARKSEILNDNDTLAIWPKVAGG